MTEFSDRYVTVATGFDRRVRAVHPDAWGNPAPCEGWNAGDIVGHLVRWVPAFFGSMAGVEFPAGSSVDEDPVGAWATLDDALRAALTDAMVAEREFDGPMGHTTVERAIDMIVTGDLLIHTWDLARAAGLDETLDLGEVRRMLEGIEPMDEALRTSGHYGPRIAVAAEADDQTKLIAFVGRDPASLSAQRVKVVRAHMALGIAHDWDGVIATFAHPRYEMHGGGAVFDGEDAVRRYFTLSRTPFPDQANEILAIAAADDTVLVEFWLTGTHLGPLRLGDQVIEATGKAFRVRMAASFEFASGSAKIVCERPYFDQGAVARALGFA